MPLLKNTAFSAFEFTMYNASGAPETGLTVTATRSIDGAAFASTTNSPTEVANGVYTIDLSAADLNGDCITFRFTATGADATLVTLFPADYGFDLNVKSSWAIYNLTAAGTTWRFTAAGAAVLVQFPVSRRFSAQRMVVKNGDVVSGNTTMGVYDSAGVLLASTVATAQSGTNADQAIALTTPVTLAPGLYFMALSNSGTTGQYTAGNMLATQVSLTFAGARGVASGGIVSEPAIVDLTTAHVVEIGQVPLISVLGFDSDELVAA